MYGNVVKEERGEGREGGREKRKKGGRKEENSWSTV
jgi:hypothetical protein